MPTRIRKLLAALTIAVAATTGLTLATTPAAADEITVNTPVTTLDTHWGLTPVDVTTVTTLDTHWG